MAEVEVDIKVNKPTVTKFKVAGKTLREVKKNRDKRKEWGSLRRDPEPQVQCGERQRRQREIGDDGDQPGH
jgi:hypothetical protein